MPFATIVRLPREVVPVFPDQCCACGSQRPGEQFRARTRPFRLRDVFQPWATLLGGWVHVEVPACPPCRSRMAWEPLRRVMLGLCGFALSLWLVHPWWRDGMQLLDISLFLVVVTTMSAVPALLVLKFWPPAFDFTIQGGDSEYEFASAEYAKLFLAANPGAVLER
jgi:hypothetical protein